MKRSVFSPQRGKSRDLRGPGLLGRAAVTALFVAAGCAQTETLEPSSSSATFGDDPDASCTPGWCGSGGAPHTGGAGGIVQTGGVPQSGGMPQTGGVMNTGGIDNTGGVSTGGVVGTGGRATGGVNTGGTSTGGKATGGTSTGGVSTGGTSTGGTSTGGTSTGGTSTGGTSTGGAASACPNYPTNDSCARCICSRCASQVAGCYSTSDATKNQQCRQIQECAEQKKCASTPCLCGDELLCRSMNGPCASVIQNVVGSTTLQTIINASNDQNHPLYRANQIGMCSTNNCRSECGL